MHGAQRTVLYASGAWHTMRGAGHRETVHVGGAWCMVLLGARWLGARWPKTGALQAKPASRAPLSARKLEQCNLRAGTAPECVP